MPDTNVLKGNVVCLNSNEFYTSYYFLHLMQDLFGTFAYNTGLIPIVGRRFNPITQSGVFSWLPLLTATITALSSLNVVSNAILIGTYKPEVALTMTVL